MRPVFNSKEYELWEEYYAIASDKSQPIDTRKKAKLQYDRLTRRGMAKAKILETIRAEDTTKAKETTEKKGDEVGQVKQPKYEIAIPIPELDSKDFGISLKPFERSVPGYRGRTRNLRRESSQYKRKRTHNS
ncbi:hypothetical protein [Alkalicoccobacillus porphyridii]|uniref:Uncharacterized protein n=1 Tax=Alkalicoccobacillus porphyridii TaxID=2597270 RepID=A0A554A0A7_9BACI|nr:hypothetical protein [Alkalicoccobacillus porphyridii]TSB47137.1 hypothetical protein FN960_08995 [Alkalicoccobacillus porphyridii]